MLDLVVLRTRCEEDTESPFFKVMLSLLDALEIQKEALQELQLGHTHNADDSHYRPLGDNYGWCDHCGTKVMLNEDIARDALTRSNERLQRE